MDKTTASNSTQKNTWIEQNPKKTLGAALFILLLIMAILFEMALRYFFGLGHPVLYDSSPLYGYRLLPNQRVARFNGAVIAVNNLGLRSNHDWDDNPTNKILFLGDSVTYGGSYLSNDDLFSAIAIQNHRGYQPGNGGVNGWGVENIHGLIVHAEFLPASTYVTVLPEKDFHRGLTRMQGLPFWNRKPNFALEELLYHFYYLQNLKRYVPWQNYATEVEQNRVVENAVIKLKQIDYALKQRGYIHLIYISPTKAQALGHTEKNPDVLQFLETHQITATYILDELNLENLSQDEIESIFFDDVHLTAKGHRVWGQIIGDDLVDLP